MIFEDAHWADPTTLEAFGRAVDRIPSLRVLLLVTFRPEFQAPWAGRPHVTSLILNRMTDREARALIDRIVGNKPLAANLQRDIIERTDGVPLFVEEMTKAVLEAGSEAAAAQAISLAPSPAVTVPPSLHATLMARLDRLGSAKEVAQIGAAIGREFSHSLLAAVARKPQGELDAALQRLTQSGLLFQQGLLPDASYLFKHALVQDAAYGTLLREHRRALHARIAKSIENQLPEIAENQPDLLARHCTEAGLIERAIALRSKAGQRSLDQSALSEAVVQFATARDLVGTLPQTSETRRQQIKFQVALLAPTTNSKGFAAPETRAAVERAQALIEEAEALGEPLDDPLLLITVLYGFWQNNFFAFNSTILDEFSRRILALAEKQKASTALMIGHRCMGVSLQATGMISAGRRHLDQAVALYNAAEHRPLVTRFPVDALVASLVSRALILWMLGCPKAALSDVDRAINEGRETRQAVSLMGALFYAAFVSTWRGEHAAARTLIDELLLIAKEKDTPFLTALGTMQLGAVLALTGDTAPAVTNLSAGIAQHRSMGSTYLTPYYLTLLAKAQAELGHYDHAWQWHFEAIEAMEKGGEVQHEAEVYRVAGEIALRQPTAGVEKAEAHFNRALDIARTQQAKSWELRAAISLARLWRDQGKVSEARGLLAPVYRWFTEGFGPRDLKEAKALLADLT
jgi:predicted ATPase